MNSSAVYGLQRISGSAIPNHRCEVLFLTSLKATVCLWNARSVVKAGQHGRYRKPVESRLAGTQGRGQEVLPIVE